MKLYKRQDRFEGEGYRSDAIITYGASTLSTNLKDGWFVSIQLPIAKTTNYIDPLTFDPVYRQVQVLMVSAISTTHCVAQVNSILFQWVVSRKWKITKTI